MYPCPMAFYCSVYINVQYIFIVIVSNTNRIIPCWSGSPKIVYTLKRFLTFTVPLLNNKKLAEVIDKFPLFTAEKFPPEQIIGHSVIQSLLLLHTYCMVADVLFCFEYHGKFRRVVLSDCSVYTQKRTIQS